MPAGGTRRSVRPVTATLPTSPLAGVTAADAMHPGLLTVAADESMATVARLMVANQIHAVLVRPATPRELGWPSHVVTDMGVVAWAIAGASAAATAGQLAGPPACVVLSQQTLEEAARVMTDFHESHVLVADQHSMSPGGVLSTFDLIAVLAGRDPCAVRAARPAPARPAQSESRLDRVAVHDAMHDGVLAATPGAGITDIAAALADHRIHCMAVAETAAHEGGDHRLVGSMLDAQAVLRAARKWDPSITAADVAGGTPVTVDESATVQAAAELMARHRVAHLVATDGAGAPTGVLSSLDVARTAISTPL